MLLDFSHSSDGHCGCLLTCNRLLLLLLAEPGLSTGVDSLKDATQQDVLPICGCICNGKVVASCVIA
jgi:hypothetical protein